MPIVKVGKDLAASQRWNDAAESYANHIEGVYHAHRFDMINRLLDTDDLTGRKAIDFGCGEGVFMEELAKRKATVWGCDICDQLIQQANQRIGSLGDVAQVERGGVEALVDLEPSSFDYLFALNVLAYMTDEEEKTFYEQAQRVLRPGGVMIVTHSNELFDLYTLNKYTVEFHRTHFTLSDEAHSIESLLSHPDKPTRSSFNIRENPLRYKFKLAKYGFEETRQDFANLHPCPPLLMDVADFDDIDSRDYTSTGDWRDEDRWKLMFMCSMFGSRSVRN